MSIYRYLDASTAHVTEQDMRRVCWQPGQASPMPRPAVISAEANPIFTTVYREGAFITLSWGDDKRPDLVMAVDDGGYEFEIVDKATGGVISQEDELSRPSGHFEHRPTKAKKPVNRRATELYWSVCVPGTTHEIVGDVAIMHDSDFKEKRR